MWKEVKYERQSKRLKIVLKYCNLKVLVILYTNWMSEYILRYKWIWINDVNASFKDTYLFLIWVLFIYIYL